jgi:uncharacterized membrane protein
MPNCWVVFELICRAGESRALELFGSTTHLCARCLGLYLGVLIGLAVASWLAPRAKRRAGWAPGLVVIAALANLAQVGAEQAGWLDPHAPTRLLLGLAAGVAVACLAVRRWPAAVRSAMRLPSLAVLSLLGVSLGLRSLALLESLASVGVVLAFLLVVSSIVRPRAAMPALSSAKDCVS